MSGPALRRIRNGAFPISKSHPSDLPFSNKRKQRFIEMRNSKREDETNENNETNGNFISIGLSVVSLFSFVRLLSSTPATG
jgi:hypothetical protein